MAVFLDGFKETLNAAGTTASTSRPYGIGSSRCPNTIFHACGFLNDFGKIMAPWPAPWWTVPWPTAVFAKNPKATPSGSWRPEATCQFLGKSVPGFPPETLQHRTLPPWRSHQHLGNHRMLAEMSVEMSMKVWPNFRNQWFISWKWLWTLSFFGFVALA